MLLELLLFKRRLPACLQEIAADILRKIGLFDVKSQKRSIDLQGIVPFSVADQDQLLQTKLPEKKPVKFCSSQFAPVWFFF